MSSYGECIGHDARFDRMDWDAYQREGLQEFEAASSAEELSDVHVSYLGRRAALPQALREVRDRETGRALNALRVRLEEAEREAARRITLRQLKQLDETLDVTLPGTPVRRGHLHPLTQIAREVEDIFLGLGYEIVDS